MERVLGIDIGGTNVKACVLELRDAPALVYEHAIATHADRRAAGVLDSVERQARKAIDEVGSVDRIGVGAPGPLDLAAGRSLRMPNLPGWENVPIVDELERRLGLPVHLINDARAMTLAEHAVGAGSGTDALVCFALGTGVGGGVVVGGRLLDGLNGTVGELGHQTIERRGRRCPCGNRGCLEQYASGPAIARSAHTSTAAEAATAARDGDVRAQAAFSEAGAALGIVIANVALAVGPERVIIGGGVARAGALLLDPARLEFLSRNRMMPTERVEILQGTLGAQAGAIGAALWAARAM